MKKWIALFAILGFLGAAAFYSPYIGINAQAQFECPVCVHAATVRGTPGELFLRFTFFTGVVNAALFVVIGSLVILCARAIKRIVPSLVARDK
jgi:hypothetical protein